MQYSRDGKPQNIFEIILFVIFRVEMKFFFYICFKDNVTAVRRLIADGVDVNTEGYLKRTPLHYAVEEGNPRTGHCLVNVVPSDKEISWSIDRPQID